MKVFAVVVSCAAIFEGASAQAGAWAQCGWCFICSPSLIYCVANANPRRRGLERSHRLCLWLHVHFLQRLLLAGGGGNSDLQYCARPLLIGCVSSVSQALQQRPPRPLRPHRHPQQGQPQPQQPRRPRLLRTPPAPVEALEEMLESFLRLDGIPGMRSEEVRHVLTELQSCKC